MKNIIRRWIEDIVWEQVNDAVKHREHPKDRTAELVRLMLDLHDKKWSFQSDRFLRELNINSEAYFKKYGVR